MEANESPEFFWQVVSELLRCSHDHSPAAREKIINVRGGRALIEINFQQLPLYQTLINDPQAMNRSNCPSMGQLAFYAFDSLLMDMYKNQQIPVFIGNDHFVYLKMMAKFDGVESVSQYNGLKKVNFFKRINRHLKQKCFICRPSVGWWKSHWLQELEDSKKPV